MGQGQSLLALTVIKNVQHECSAMCSVKLNFGQIKEHEETCDWRLIPCPGMGLFCKANTPLVNVLNHAEVCPTVNGLQYRWMGRGLFSETFWGLQE